VGRPAPATIVATGAIANGSATVGLVPTFHQVESSGHNDNFHLAFFPILASGQTILSLTPPDLTHAEGNSGTTPFTFTVLRSGDVNAIDNNATSVDFQVTGSGTQPADAADFIGGNLPQGTLNFGPGETSKTIIVPVAGDTVPESDETFTLALLNTTSAVAIATGTATATIENDDPVIITGPAAEPLFVGTPDNDTITPATISAGVQILPANSDLTGDDAIVALAGDDVVEGDSGSDIASLGDGSDRFIWNTGDGDDIVDGGAGTDTLEFNGSAAPEFMTVMTLEDGGFRFFRNVGDITVDATTVERIEVNSGDGNDVIIASGQTDPTVSLVVEAGGGNDVIVAGAGNDDLKGNTGDDVAFGLSGDDRFTWDPGDGDDTFDGGDGTDTLAFNGSNAAELMTVTTLDNGGFRFFRDLGDITVDTINVEHVEVNALGGDDTVDGSAQTRSDVALEIRGGAGNDNLTGGAGPDSFIFAEESGNGVVETDTITGYSQAGGDVVDVSEAGGVIASQVVAGNLELTLGGGDNDLVVLQGVTDVTDVTFII
jgi:Ca2+-binding RTX toxin-like protein